MKIRIWSDVHNEFGRLTVTKKEDDKDTVLVIAGDYLVWSDPNLNEILDEDLHGLCEQFKAVVYCCGNHEFYGSKYEDVIEGLLMFSDSHPNFHFLDGGGWPVIDEVRFVGGTLWTDYNGGDEYAMQIASSRMNDFGSIKTRAGRFNPEFAYFRNKECRRRIKSVCETPFAGKTVVVTHHLPDHKKARDYVQGELEYAYGNTNMDSILELPIDLWIHGHVHIRQEYMLGKVPVVANPRGYHKYQAMAYTFDDAKTWEI